MLYHVGRQPKVKFEASIPSRNFNTFKKKNQNKTHNIQNLLFSSSACGLPCVRRQRWKCTGYAILIPVITERSPELSQFHAQNSLFKTLILFPDFLFSDFFVVRERKKKTEEDKHLVIRICKFVVKGSVNVVPVFTQTLLSTIKSH